MMKHILILGIGRSTYYLLQYLQEQLVPEGYIVTAIDAQPELIAKRKKEFPGITFISSQITDESLQPFIIQTDVVVSMLPPAFHIAVAKLCLIHNKHLFTASYVSEEMKLLQAEVTAKGLLFMMECGLDPGIDHMSAMDMIHTLRERGALIDSFESYTGGLVHPASANPPWNYKISWNPRNVVLAGQGAPAQYRRNGRMHSVSYEELFSDLSTWEVSGEGTYEGYPNRDSLSYASLYDLKEAATFVRGTLRYTGYCEGWNYLIQLGLTDDVHVYPADPGRTASRFLQQALKTALPADTRLKELFPETYSSVWSYLDALDLTKNVPVMTEAATAAQILQSLLIQKWGMNPGDRDRIVMIHRIGYTLNNKQLTMQCSLIADGEDAERTAMAKTVGLPLAIALKLFLHNTITETGIIIPVLPEIYTPILKELKEYGISFKENNK